MQLVYGELWTYKADWYGITTNGSTNRWGENVMGSGCAREFKDKFPGSARKVGDLLASKGNHVHLLDEWNVFTFPTKHQWHENSDVALIIQSSRELAAVANFRKEETFVLPRPGVGAGRLKWDDVLPKITELLPDNVHVITWDTRANGS